MLSHEKAVLLNSQLQSKASKLFYPPQNLVDLIWKEKPAKSKEQIYVQPLKYAGMEAGKKLQKLREWIKEQPPTVPSYSKTPPTPAQMQVGTMLSNLACIGTSRVSIPLVGVLNRTLSLASQSPRRRYSFQSRVPLLPIRITRPGYPLHRACEGKRVGG